MKPEIQHPQMASKESQVEICGNHKRLDPIQLDEDELDSRDYLEKAIVLSKDGNYLCASDLLSKVIQIKPFEGSFHSYRGLTLLKQERLSEAAAEFSLASRIYNWDRIARIGVGITHILLGFSQIASDALLRISWRIKSKDQKYLISDWRWISLIKSNRLEEAQDEIAYVSARETVEMFEDSYMQCLLYKDEISLEEALAFLERNEEKIEYFNGSGKYGIYHFLLSHGRTEEARDLLEKESCVRKLSLSAIAARVELRQLNSQRKY